MTVGSHCSRMPIFSRFAVDGRHERPLVRVAGFLLDDRRERDELADAQAARRGLRAELRRQRLLEAVDHARDELRGGRAARQRIGVREQVAFEIARVRIEVAGSSSRVATPRPRTPTRAEALALEELAHLPDGEPLAKRDRPQVDVAARDLRDDLPRRHRPIEPVLARLQPPCRCRCAPARTGN